MIGGFSTGGIIRNWTKLRGALTLFELETG